MRTKRKKFYPESSTAMNPRRQVLIAAIAIILTFSPGDGAGEKASVTTEAQRAEIIIEQPAVIERYAEVTMTEDERRSLAAIIYLEAQNQPAKGQQAVAEVVLNRVISNRFPNTVHDVIHQGAGTRTPQFSTISMVDTADPQQEQYDAISAALYGSTILPADVVYFSLGGENKRTWGVIGDHVFCYQYQWE